MGIYILRTFYLPFSVADSIPHASLFGISSTTHFSAASDSHARIQYRQAGRLHLQLRPYVFSSLALRWRHRVTIANRSNQKTTGFEVSMTCPNLTAWR